MRREVVLLGFVFLLVVSFVVAKDVDSCVGIPNEIRLMINELQEDGETVVLREGDKIRDGDYFVLSSGDNYHLMEMINVNIMVSPVVTSDVSMKDLISGLTYNFDNHDFTSGYSGYVGGQVYLINNGTFVKPSYVNGTFVKPSYVTIYNSADGISTYDCNQVTCTDSDGGKDYYTKGNFSYGSGGISSDWCSSSFGNGAFVSGCSADDIGCTLVEYYCRDDVEIPPYPQDKYTCPKGCSDGACIDCVENWNCASWSAVCTSGLQTRTCNDLNACGSSISKPVVSRDCPTGKCTDSDDGKNYYVKGITHGPYVNNTDSCSSTGVYVWEEYCNDLGTQLGEYYKCPNGCVDGACVSCLEDWSCTSWSNCTNSQQTRTCSDSNSCGTIKNRPSLSQSCVVGVCSEDWTCTNWGFCVDNQEIRVCTDLGGCGTTKNKPSVIQSCNVLSPNEIIDELNNVEVIGGLEDVKSLLGDEYKVKFKGKEFVIKKEENSGELILMIDDEEIAMDAIMSILQEFSEYSSSSDKENVNILSEKNIKDIVDKVDKVDKIELKEENEKLVYVVSGVKKAKLFFLIPISASIEQIVDVKTGELILVKKPWWHFLALGI